MLRATELAIQLADVDGALSRLDTLRAHAELQDAWLEWRGEILLQAGRQQEAAAAFVAALRELDQRSTTRRTADATVARSHRLERRLRELGIHDPSKASSPPLGSALPVQTGEIRTSTASASPGSVVLTRGPYVQLATDRSIVARWRTDLDSSSRVAWGPTPSELDSEIVDLSEVIEHEVEIEGLDPSTCYVYEVGTATDILAGGDTGHLLCTAAEEDEAVRIWVIGDSGTANHNAAAVRDAYLGLFPDPRPDVWLMLGDNAYTEGTDAEYQAAVFEMYPTILAHAAVWPTIGNHDAISSSSVSQTGPYFENFTLPAGGEAGGMLSGTEAYYSFDHGPVHFVCLDSSGFFTPPTAMLDWLEADLVSTARQWILVYFHHPPYSKGSHDSDNPNDSGGRMFKMREIVLPILESQGVDLVLSGHSHSYERSVLLDGHYGTSDSLTPEMIVDGGDGSPAGDGAYIKSPGSHQGTVYVVAGSSGLVSNGDLDHPVMYISLKELGSMVLLVDPQSLEAIFLNSESQTPDLFRIEKPPILIFGDGFESGDTSTWSETWPG